jgi:hypothetical protein
MLAYSVEMPWRVCCGEGRTVDTGPDLNLRPNYR